ncbi:MAG: PEP-CTERM sorting domain-containing protein [Pseudomonadota bacterium]
MANFSAQALRLNKFQQRTLIVFGVVAVLSSLPDSERRGLLVWNSPEALIADVGTDAPAGLGTGLAILGATGRPGRTGIPRGGIATIGQSPVGDPATGGAPGGALALPQASPLAGPVPSAASNGSQASSATGGLPAGPGVGFSPAVVGATTLLATAPVTPQVPAIPEPSSWILMILGTGLLGAALRHSRAIGRIEARKGCAA